MASPRIDTSGKLSAAITHVNFVCQKCRLPLKLDQSFNLLNHPLLVELSEPLTSNIDDGKDGTYLSFLQAQNMPEYEEDPNVVKLKVPPIRNELEISSDFTLLGETGPGSMENLSHRMKEVLKSKNSPENLQREHFWILHFVVLKVSDRTKSLSFSPKLVSSVLFDIMSGQSEIDHPLCEECTDTLLDRLDQQLRLTEDECRDYREFLEKLISVENKVDENALDEELKQLHKEEEQLLQQLVSIEHEQRRMEELIFQEKQEACKLDEEEEKYYREYAEQKRQRLELEDDKTSVENQMQYCTGQLSRLKQINVFNATFHIWHSGHFGTINNFRLGRLPNIQVDWNEINAAWGQTVLLLYSLARRVGLTFQRYRLVPYGSHSYVEALTDKAKELPLYGSGGFRFLWDTKFDMGMVAFLDCLDQLWAKIGGTISMPYKIHRDKLQDRDTQNFFSIKIQFNSEEQWTKALKFMLTDLKWCLSWIQAQSAK